MAHTKTAKIYVGGGDAMLLKEILYKDPTQARWNTVHNATSADDASNDLKVEVMQVPDNPGYSWGTRICRVFLPFDTTSIDNGAVFSAGTLKVYATIAETTGGGVGVVKTTQSSPTTISLSDYDNCGSTHSPIEGATRVNITSDGWKTFTLNATGLSWIDPTGYTKLGLRAAYDLDDTYTGDDWFMVFIDGYADTNKPYLSLTYTISRYWVGGTGNWSDTSHWAYTSGGEGGASVPDEDMDVIFDENSFTESGQVCTINTSASVYSLDLSGVTNNPTFAGSSNITIVSTFTTSSGITWNHTGEIILTSTGTHTFTSNGIDFKGSTLKFNGSGSSWTLGDGLTISQGTLNLLQGTLNTNGKDVVVKNFTSSNTNTRTLNCGATSFTLTGTWNVETSTNLTYTTGTSTITLSGDNAYFKGGGQTYNSVTLTGTPITITGSNTFGTLELTAGKQVNLTAGTTQTVTTFTATGTSGNLITIRSTTPGTAATLSKASGTVTCDYLDLKDSTATGGATWRPGDNSTDSGNNTGWSQPWTNPTNAYSSDDSYATHTSPNGKLYAKVSKDGGTTWTDAQYVTFAEAESIETYGDGETELWGTSWKGSDVTDDKFKIKLYAGSPTSFNYQVYGTANLDDDISPESTVTGINLQAEGKWDGTTMSLDHIKVTAYFGNSPLEIDVGSLAYDSDIDTLAVYTGSAWRKLAPTNSADFTGTVTISDGGLEAEEGIVSSAYLRGGKMYVDYIKEHTNDHGIVIDDGLYVDSGNIGLSTDTDLIALTNNTVTVAGNVSATTFNGGFLTKYLGHAKRTSSFSTTSTSFVDVTGLSITATTDAARVLLLVSSDTQNNTAGARNSFSFDIDGTTINSRGFGLAAHDMADASDSEIMSIHYITDVLEAGEHTFKVRMRVSDGTGYIAGTSGRAVFSAIQLG